MSEFLTVRVSSDPQQPINWLVWSTSQKEVIASGELEGIEQLDSLAQYAQHRSVIALISGQDAVIHQVEIPAGSRRKLDAVIPYLLEDDIAQDVDQMHFSVLSTESGMAHVCSIEQELLKSWIQTFSEAGLTLNKIMPDILALPVSSDDIGVMQLGTQWLFRYNEQSGTVVDDEWLALFLSSQEWQDQWRNTEKSICCYTALPAQNVMDSSLQSPTDVELPKEWQLDQSLLPMAQLTQQAVKSPVNLLTGSFKGKSSWLKHWKIWQKAVAASLFLFAVWASLFTVNLSKTEQEISAYRAESERIFRTVFEGKKRIPTVSYLKRQFTDEEKRLTGKDTSGELLTWLQHLPEQLAKVPNMKIQSMKFDASRREMRIQAQSSEFQDFEVARESLSELFEVQQGQINRRGSDVVGSFVIAIKGETQ